jgi:ferredoxin-NADP reductase
MSTTAVSPVTMAKLLSRHEVAEGTTAFRFEKPSNWTFKSGQYLDMTLLDPSETDAEGMCGRFPSRALLTKTP